MKELFDPVKEMLQDMVSGFLGIINTIAILGIIVCAVGSLTGSQQSKEKFKAGIVWIFIAFIVINLAKQIISAISGYL
ncbi:MAG: TrbC/VirB2 family protein [Senegalia sp. (in: firmicutes)]